MNYLIAVKTANTKSAIGQCRDRDGHLAVLVMQHHLEAGMPPPLGHRGNAKSASRVDLERQVAPRGTCRDGL